MRLKTVIQLCILSILLCMSLNSFALATHKPLKSDQAFVVSITKINNGVKLNWVIAPGYYLYRERLLIKSEPQVKLAIQLPRGEFHHDVDRGAYEVFADKFSVPVQLPAQLESSHLTFQLDYQGCSQEGFCYPPVHKTIPLDLNNLPTEKISSSATSGFFALLSDQEGIKNFLHEKQLGVMLLVFAGLGLLLSFTPCVLPMIPILTSIIVGQGRVTSQKAFFLSLAYVLGSALTYSVAGLIAVMMGNSLQAWLQKPWLIMLASGLFVLLALSLFGLYELKIPARWQNRLVSWSNRYQGGSYAGVFLMGLLSTLIVSPCVTAPLVGVLMYIAQTGDKLLGAGALFAMGLGMGLPLLLIGASAGKWLPKSGAWMEAVKKSFGLLMLGMAIWLVSRVASPGVIKMAESVLVAGCAVFFAYYLPSLIGWRKLNRSVAVLAGVFSLLLMVYGVRSLVESTQTSQSKAADNFTVVRNIDDFNTQLALANAAHKAVILDFYADWCESCVAMDRKVFRVDDVQNVLAQYIVLRADLSANSAADQALLKHFDVIAPPTVLIFDNRGKEINANRIVGEVDAKEFLSHLSSAMRTNQCDKNINC